MKYFKGRMIINDRSFPYVVWDGVRNYENPPAPALLQAEGLSGRVFIVQIRNPTVGVKFIGKLFAAGADSVIVVARNNKTYRAIVKNCEAESHARMQ